MTATAFDHTIVDIDGPVHVLDFGGPTRSHRSAMVLVHGLDGSAANWVDVGPGLAAGRRVVAPDLPGFGRTPLHRRRVDLPSIADHLARVVDRLDLGPVTLVGNSWGAPVALWTAARHPGRVVRVVLVAPALPRDARRRLDPVFAAGFLLPHALPGLVRAEPARRHRLAPAARVWMSRPAAFHRVAGRVLAPVHVVEGGADPVIPATSIARALGRHPQWTHTVLRAVGHVPQLEDPAGFVAAVEGSG